ncbi:MAG: hypothetical protein M3174_02615 [Actinomycetota bacterium]|nr:hypothetical protein [Actinomycetota bacterium]
MDYRNSNADSTQRRTSRALRGWAIALASVLVFAACDGGGETTNEAASTPAAETSSPATTSAEEYVSTLCTEMQNWLTRLQEGQAQVQESVQPGSSPQDGQQALAAFFDSAIAATDQLVTAVQNAGVPDVEGGEQISEELTSRFEEARAALESARAQVDQLPVDDPEAFRAAAEDLGASIQSQLEAIGQALSTLSQPELDQAASTDPTCTGLSPTQ